MLINFFAHIDVTFRRKLKVALPSLGSIFLWNCLNESSWDNNHCYMIFLSKMSSRSRFYKINYFHFMWISGNVKSKYLCFLCMYVWVKESTLSTYILVRFKSRVSEMHVKWIRIKQGLGVLGMYNFDLHLAQRPDTQQAKLSFMPCSLL